MTGGFLSSETWKQVLEDRYHSVPVAAVRSLTEADVEDLLEVFASGGMPARLAAFHVLRGPAQRRNEFPEVPWSEHTHARFVLALGSHVKACFVGQRPFSEPGAAVMCWLWRALDPGACRSFLMTVPIEGAEARDRTEVLRLLASQARSDPDARAYLEALAAQGGALSVEAREALETSGIVSPERLAHWSRLWREQRIQEALDWLYYRWIDYLPVGYPAADILAILGPPTDGELPDVYYSAGEGHVYLELYESTGLSGCHHT